MGEGQHAAGQNGRGQQERPEVTQPIVSMYVSDWCPYCQRAKALLKQKDVTFNEINVEEDEASREEMVRRSQRRTVPQIFIGDKHVGGCDELYALDRSGELDRLIQGAG
jgi:glutaredoxin 3